MKIEKTHMSKSKPCFEILGKKAFRRHLETWENQIGSIFKLNIKKILPGGGGGRWWEEGAGKIFFWNLTLFYIFNLKILSI